MRHERSKAQGRIVPPVGSAIGLPPGPADRVGAQPQPHAELKHPREGAGRRQADDQALQDAEPRIGLHDANEAQDGVGGDEAIRVQRDRELMLTAPARAEIADVAGLEAGIGRAPAVGDGNAIAPRGRERGKARALGG